VDSSHLRPPEQGTGRLHYVGVGRTPLEGDAADERPEPLPLPVTQTDGAGVDAQG
jgi:hypothetical protein